MSTPDPPPPLGVGMVGYAFMGTAHSRAWRTAARPAPPLAAVPSEVFASEKTLKQVQPAT